MKILKTEIAPDGSKIEYYENGKVIQYDAAGTKTGEGSWNSDGRVLVAQETVAATRAKVQDWQAREKVKLGTIAAERATYDMDVAAVTRAEKRLDDAESDARNERIAAGKETRQDAKDAAAKAERDAAKAAAGSGPAPVSKSIVPPGMMMLEADPANPGVWSRVIYSYDSRTGATSKEKVGDTSSSPVAATDFYQTPSGEIYSLRDFDSTGRPRAGAKPVFTKGAQYTSSGKIWNDADQSEHYYVWDPNNPTDKKDMGKADNPAAARQTEALTQQYLASAKKSGVDTQTSEFELAQKKDAVKYGEAVYRKDLTAVEAMLKQGRVEEAQKAFSEAQKNWEATASARMREKGDALTKGSDAEDRAFFSKLGKTPAEGKAQDQRLYNSIPGQPGDSASMRLARQMGYSDAIDYQRGPTQSWGEFSSNTPQSATGQRNYTQAGPSQNPVPVTAPTAPIAPQAVTPNAGGRSIDLGGGLYWWDNGSGTGEMFHMAPKTTGSFGADGEREVSMVPTSLDATGLYKNKTLLEARQLAGEWFSGPADPATKTRGSDGVVAGVSFVADPPPPAPVPSAMYDPSAGTGGMGAMAPRGVKDPEATGLYDYDPGHTAVSLQTLANKRAVTTTYTPKPVVVKPDVPVSPDAYDPSVSPETVPLAPTTYDSAAADPVYYSFNPKYKSEPISSNDYTAALYRALATAKVQRAAELRKTRAVGQPMYWR